MNIIAFVFCFVVLITSTSSYAYTYKCKNQAGKITYSGSPCPPSNNEMHAETILINGQRRLTKDQLLTIEQHHEEDRAIRNRKAEQLRSTDVDKLRALQLEAKKLPLKK
jgi:sRNA-binding protein